MKRVIKFILALYLLVAGATSVWANEALNVDVIRVFLNNEEIRFDQSPINDNGRILVPIRAISEAIGAEVTWDDPNQKATIVNGNTLLEITIDSMEMSINGEKKLFDVPAKMIGKRTLVPVRAVSETFGANVEWSADENTVYISMANNQLDINAIAKALDENLWQNYSFEERRVCLQQLEDYIAREQGRMSYKITLKQAKNKDGENIDEVGGLYYPETRALIISNHSNRDYPVIAVLHEGRHGYQHAATLGEVANEDEAIIAIWKMAMPGVIGDTAHTGVYYEAIGASDLLVASKDWTRYRFQPIEDDAYCYGYEKFEEIFKKEIPADLRGYERFYLNGLEEHYCGREHIHDSACHAAGKAAIAAEIAVEYNSIGL